METAWETYLTTIGKVALTARRVQALQIVVGADEIGDHRNDLEPFNADAYRLLYNLLSRQVTGQCGADTLEQMPDVVRPCLQADQMLCRGAGRRIDNALEPC